LPYVIRLLICLPFVFNAIGLARADTGWNEPRQITSRVLGQTRGYRVMLPPDYNSNSKRYYPLLLLLDGQRYGDVVAGNARFLAEVGEIPEHIIVAVDSGNRMRDFTPTDSPGWEGDGGGEFFLNFLSSELLPALERDFRIERPHIIWGHSLAGLFVFYTIYAAPNAFDARLVSDGPLDWDDKTSEKALRNFLKNQTPPNQFLYFNSSYLAPMVDPEQRYFETLSTMLKANAPANLRWIYDPLPKETHASIPLLGSIKGLRALYEGYLIPESVMLKGLDTVLKHYATIKGRVGAPVKVPESVLNDFGYLMLGQDTAEAIRAFELATRSYPGSVNAWDSLSDGYLEAGRLKDALKATEKSIELANISGDENIDYLKKKRVQITERM
jgi:predicted alpha/beta superfamily hydrolase